MVVNYRLLHLKNSSIAIVAFLLLSGCGPLPRPFQHIEPDPNLRLEYVSGVTVLPIQGMSGDMATVLAQSLGRAGIPAVAITGSVNSLRLFGELTELETEGSQVRYALQWELQDADGISITLKNQIGNSSIADWNGASPDLLRSLADQAASLLTPTLLGEDVVVATPPTAPLPPRLAIVGIEGAPGDGNKSLAKGLEQALRQMGFKLSPIAEAELLIAAKITMSEGKKGDEHIKIDWYVSRPDEYEIGKITQENDIPKGSLNGKWGAIAGDIAEATSYGLVDVMRKYVKGR
jgi:hypothetical protein